MQIPKLMKISLLTVVILILIASVAAYRSAKWVLRRVEPGHQVALDPSAALQRTSFNPGLAAAYRGTRLRGAMSEAFDTGRLPSPWVSKAVDPDEEVVELARRIAARDNDSTAALLTALQKSGLTVEAKDRSILVQPDGPGQGIAFEAWEVAAMAKLYGENWHISMNDLTVILAKSMPQLGRIPLSKILIAGIVESSGGAQPMRFWSRLLIELGKNSFYPYDLSSAQTDAGGIQLDAIQVALIMRRLGGDLTAAAKNNPHFKPASFQPERSHPRVRVEPAVYHPRHHARLIRVDDSGSTPCKVDEWGAIIVDVNAIVRTTEWNKIIDIANEEGVPLEGRINAVFIILRFYLVYAGLHADISINKSPLVRTKDTDPGETAKLTAHIWWNLDGSDLSCLIAILRGFMNAAGLDVGNFPDRGDVDGVGVTWYLTEGGVDPNIKVVDQATADAQKANAIVMLDPGDKHTLINQITDKEGKAFMPVTGLPQKRDLSQDHPSPVMKKFAVAVEVKFKGADPEKFLGELTDILGPALGLAAGDVLGGLAGGITEMLYRMSWQIDGSQEFDLQDWAANGVWVGAINYSWVYKSNPPPHTSRIGANGTLTAQDETDNEATMTVNFVANPDGSQGVTGTESRKEISRFHRSGYSPGCSSNSNEERTIKVTPQGFQGGAVIAPLSGSPPKYRATVTIGGMAVWTTETTTQSQFSGCNGTLSENKHVGPEQSNGPFSPASLQVDGTVDPLHPDVININEINDDGWGNHVSISGHLQLK